MSSSLLNSINIFDKLILEHGGAPVFKAHIELLREQARFFESKVADLERQVGNLQAEKTDLQQTIKNQQEEIEHYKKKIAIAEKDYAAIKKELAGLHEAPPLKFDPKSGTWLDETTQIRYCPSCKLKGLLAPLQERERGWKCNSNDCNQFYSKPRVPQIEYRTVQRKRFYK